MTVALLNVLGLAVIGWVVWYFFLSKRSDEAAATVTGGVQEVHVTIKGGYIPDVIHARPGVPLRVHFRREETSPCSEEVVFPDLGVRKHLPAFETTAVDLPAPAEGTYGFSCAMGMMHGTLKVTAEPASVPAATASSAADRDAWPVDPICGMRVNPEKPAATSVRDGVTYYFCAVGCQSRFEGGAGPMAMGQSEGIQLGVRRK